ncbi:MAG: hypothetical protein SangKO_078050 [Sandaracinaceae bacterium]
MTVNRDRTVTSAARSHATSEATSHATSEATSHATSEAKSHPRRAKRRRPRYERSEVAPATSAARSHPRRAKRGRTRDIYQLFVERNGRAATIITSNRDTSEWIATFDDVLLAQSAVDRFINNAYDLVVEGESYRARLKPTVDETSPPPTTPVTKPDHPIRKRRR